MHDNPPNRPSNPPDQFEGLLLGTMVGDALRLPDEGLKPVRSFFRNGALPLLFHN